MFAQLIRASLLTALFLGTATAQTDSPQAALSPRELAVKMRTRASSSFYIRMRMEVRGNGQAERAILQVQLKGRRTDSSSALLYQVMYPKGRKGEGVLIHRKNGRFVSGFTYSPAGGLRPLAPDDVDSPLFGSDISPQEMDQSFWEWKNQTQAGTGKIGGADCIIIDSVAPGQTSRIRSWIDSRLMIPLRIEKFSADGSLQRVIETTHSIKIDGGHYIPDRFVVTSPALGTSTVVEGVSQKPVVFPDAQFHKEALLQVTGP